MYIHQVGNDCYVVCEEGGKILANACDFNSAWMFYRNEMKRIEELNAIPFLSHDHIEEVITINDLNKSLDSFLKDW